VVLNSINHIRQANLIRQASVSPDIFSSESENELWLWMQAASGIAYAVFLVALGSYVVLWLAPPRGIQLRIDASSSSLLRTSGT
jgi:hypothetical protein